MYTMSDDVKCCEEQQSSVTKKRDSMCAEGMILQGDDKNTVNYGCMHMKIPLP